MPSVAASRCTASRRSARIRQRTGSSRRCAGSRTSPSPSVSSPGRAPATGAASSPTEPTWIGIVPVGYADGFRRDMSGTEVLVQGARRRVVGPSPWTRSPCSSTASSPAGTPVTLVGDGILMEEHARVAGTIALRDRDGPEHAVRSRPAGHDRWMSASARSWAARTRGSSVARSATSSSCGPFSTSTSPAPTRARRRAASPAASAALGLPALRAPRRLARGRRRHRRDRRLHAGRRGDRRRPRDPRLHVQRDRRPRVERARRTTRTTAARDLEAGVIRAVSESIFLDDPLRLLRAVRFEDELGFRMDERTESLLRASAALVTQPAGERVLAGAGTAVAARAFGAWTTSGCSRRSVASSTAASTHSTIRTSASSSSSARTSRAFRSRTSSSATRRALRRARRPQDPSPRAIHRFRRDTEPWALDALAFVGAPELVGVVEAARRADPPAPLVRGDELGIDPGPAIGRILDVIDEERAAGTISTREEALALARELAAVEAGA